MSKATERPQALEVLFEPGAVVELRAFSGRNTASGYFEDHGALREEAAKLDGRGFSVYVTLNEVNPALLARSENKVKHHPKATTADADILRRRWLPIDFDPVRPADVSATGEEKQASLWRAQEVRDYLREKGWPEPVVADSGNGAHLLYRVELENDGESLELIKGVLEALSLRYSDKAVNVDVSTSNAARIWKLYGTTARKGDDTQKRPHRLSRLLRVPEEVEAAGRERLETLAAQRPAPPPFGPGFAGRLRGGRKDFDLETWIRDRGVPVRREGPWQQGGHKYVLEECPWNGHTDNSAYIVRFASGAIAAGCHHNSCEGRGWRDLREHYEPGAYECNGYERSADDQEDGSEPEEKSKQPPQSEMLVRYAADAELFHTPAGDAYATIPVSGASGDHRETHAVRSKGFRQFLRRRFHEDQEKIPGSQAIQDALEQLEGEAQIAGEERPVYVRVAECEGAIYLDLANARWEVVEVIASGWRVISLEDAPVRFRRPRGMLPLPTPAAKPGGSIEDLRRFINLGDEESWRLIVAWLLAAMKPSGPYPVLILQGEQGSAKSTAERLLKALADPSVAPLRTTPRNEHDLYISADSSHIVAFDNISSLHPWLSDAVCRLSTGGGFSTRTLYENREQELFEGMRPLILNGISDVATRPDLLDRALIVTLPRIPEEERRTEGQLWSEFESARPAILGALLEALSGALGTMPSLRLEGMKLPRMADFALWAMAAEGTLGWKSGAFMEAYAGNRAEATESALDADPVAEAVRQFMADRNAWSGKMSELWEKLGEIAGEEIKRSRAWPGAPNVLSGRLKRIAPALRDIGIEYAESADKHRTKSLKKIDVKDRHHRNHRHREKNILQNGTFLGDDDGDDLFASDDKTVTGGDPVSQDRHQKSPANERIGGDDDGGDDDMRLCSELDGLLEDRPGWLRAQARKCLAEGAPERLLKPLASSVAADRLGNVRRWQEALPFVREHLETLAS